MDTAQARIWLKENGYNVKPKGRIPSDLLAIYQAKVDKPRATSSNTDDSDSDDTDGASMGGSKKRAKKRQSCGFCTVNSSYRHKYCPGTINQGKLGLWVCLCYEKDHQL